MTALFAIGQNASAQQQEQLSLYSFNPLMFNPAYAGSRGTVNGSIIARNQWVGFNGAPQTGYFSMNAPLRNKSIGLGLNVVSDKIGKRNANSAYASVAYSIKLNKKDHRLCFGINGGVDMIKYDFNQLTVLDNTDPIYSTTFNSTAFNIGSGIYNYSEKHYIGVSCPKILEPSISNLSATTYSAPSLSTLKRHFFFMAGYVFKVNSITKLKTSTLVKSAINTPLTADLNLNVIFNDKFNIGGLYRYNEAVGANITFIISNAWSVGYAYDYVYNGIKLYQNGSHEIMVMFDLKTKHKSYLSPRYF